MAMNKSGSCEVVNEWACKQTSLRINAIHFFGKTIVLGNITSITDRCMCISTQYCVPVGSSINLLISYRKNLLVVPGTVARYLDREGADEAMCVEVCKSSTEYLEFFNCIEQRECV